MAERYTVVQGSDLPDYSRPWLASDGSVIDFSSGYTFQVKVGNPGSAAAFTKTTGITGAATSPNITIAWATSGELNTLTPGAHTLQVKATRTSDSKERFMTDTIIVLPVIT